MTSPRTVPIRGRRAAPTVPVDAGQASAGALPLPSEPATTDDILAGLLAEYGGAAGYRVRVERMDDKDTPAYLGTVDLTTELEEEVRSRWGGGRYRGRVVDDQSRYKARIRFTIAGAPRNDGDDARAVALPTAAAPASRLETVLEQFMATMAATVQGIAEAVRPRAQVNPVDDVVAVARALKELTPAAAPAQSQSAVEVFDLVHKVLALRDDIAGQVDREPPSDFGAIVEGGVKPLLQVMNRSLDLQEKRMQQRRIPAPGVVPVATVPAASPVATTDDGALAVIQRVPRSAWGFLLGCAQRDADPALYADMALDLINDDDVAAIRPLLDGDAFLSTLCAAVPALTPHREWFARFCGELAQAIDEHGRDDAAQPAGTEDAQP